MLAVNFAFGCQKHKTKHTIFSSYINFCIMFIHWDSNFIQKFPFNSLAHQFQVLKSEILLSTLNIKYSLTTVSCSEL